MWKMRSNLAALVVWTCIAHAALVASIALSHAIAPERWWMTGLNMYVPQFVWAVPALILLPMAACYAPRWTWLPAGVVLCVAGPLMGFCWSLPREADGVRVRVMTYNVQSWVQSNVAEVVSEIRAASPDVLTLQDARNAEHGPLGALLREWNVISYGQYAIASRFPIMDTAVGDISYRGERHTYLRAELRVANGSVIVSTVHFVTPRDALEAIRAPESWRTRARLIETNLTDRVAQARALAEDLREIDGPLIVAGDLNAPVQSLTVRTLTRLGLRDAFCTGGRGYGYTFGHTQLGLSFLRLDQILVSRHFMPVSCSVGGSGGSDHRPVIADLILMRIS